MQGSFIVVIIEMCVIKNSIHRVINFKQNEAKNNRNIYTPKYNEQKDKDRKKQKEYIYHTRNKTQNDRKVSIYHFNLLSSWRPLHST